MENNAPQILLIYTGGTIGMVKDYKSNALKPFDFENIKIKIPELKLLDCKIETTAFLSPIDSSDMNPEEWVKIAEIIESRYDDIDGFVVLTGTDTMSYTSSAMSFILQNLSKPVIFTGSQLPIGDLRTDAKENLITAIQVAASRKNGKAVVQEVALYFEYKLYRANRTTKVSSEQFEAFESANYPHLAESGVHLNFNESHLLRTNKKLPLKLQRNFNAKVLVLKLFPGMSRSVVEHMLSCPDLEGLIIETYGAGNAPTASWFTNALTKLIDKNIPVINVTQCISGGVLMGHYETSVHLKKMGVISGKNITTESALAKLKLLVGNKVSSESFKGRFEVSMRGEMN